MENTSFKNLFNQYNNFFQVKKEEINIKTFPINKVPDKLFFPDFQLVKGLKHTINNSKETTEREIINITKSIYKIKITNIISHFYRLAKIIVNNKKYNFYTDAKDYKSLRQTSFSSLKKISENPDAFWCVDLKIKEDYLYIVEINSPQKCNMKNLDECFDVIFHIANVCNIKKIKIIDVSHFICDGESIYLSYLRMLGKKSLSIYSKYGFTFEEEPLDDRDYEILNNFNIDNFIDEITLILDSLKMENFKCISNNRNITSEEFILKTKILDFLNFQKQINMDTFSKKIDMDNCFVVLKIINIIETVGDYIVKINNTVINKICIDIKNVFDKFKNTNSYQVLYL